MIPAPPLRSFSYQGLHTEWHSAIAGATWMHLQITTIRRARAPIIEAPHQRRLASAHALSLIHI
eukprot:1470990-Prorocentrum_lima.AAC.1